MNRKKVLYIVFSIIFIPCLVLYGIYLSDKPFVNNSQEFDFAFQHGILFAFLMEGFSYLLHDIFIKKIFRKKDPT